MANEPNKVSVELRLLLDKLNADIAKAAAAMKVGLSRGAAGTSDSVDKAAKSMDEFEKKTRKANTALADQKKAALDAWRASLPQPQVRGVGFDAPGAGKGKSTWSTGAGGGLATAPPFSKPPAPPRLPPGFYPLPTGGGGSPAPQNPWHTPLAIAAQLGAAMAGLRVAVGLVKWAFDKLLTPLRMVLAAAESARRLYASSLMSGGQGVGVTARKGVLASVIGVSEDDVLSYGYAVAQLNTQLETAIRVFTETNAKLTATGWGVKVMQTNFSALVAKISSEVTPGINRLTGMFSDFFKLLMDTDWAEALGKGFSIAVGAVRLAVGVMLGAVGSFVLGIQVIASTILWLLQKINNGAAALHLPGFTKDNSDPFKGMMAGAKDLNDLFRQMLQRGAGDRSAPAPMTSINRMAASAWERMGLVVGRGGGISPQVETARNTRRANALLEKIVNTIAPRGETYTPKPVPNGA